MQSLGELYADLLLSNEFVYDQAPIVRMTIGGSTTLPISDFNMSREYGALAQQISIKLSNINPNDPNDVSYYNATRDNPEHNRTKNSYFDIIKPEKSLELEVGYGTSLDDDTITIFKGYVDTVKEKINSSESYIEIIGREKSRNLVDKKIKHLDNGEIVYNISYPIEADWDTYVLDSGDTNPYLYQIWDDVIARAGLTGDYTTYGGNDCELRLNDVNSEFFQNITGNWIDFLKNLIKAMLECTYLTLYQFERNETIYLAKLDWFDSDYLDNEQLNGTNWSYLNLAMYRAIEDSLSVRHNTNNSIEYIKDVDYEYDYAKHAIRRIATGDIGDGDFVNVFYTGSGWSYKPNQIYDLEKTKSTNNMYGLILGKNDEFDLETSWPTGELEDGTELSTDKVLELSSNVFVDSDNLLTLVLSKREEMKKNYITIVASVVTIPHLESGDVVHFLIYGMIENLYRIIGLTINYNADKGFDMQVKCDYYDNAMLFTESYFMTSDGKYFCTSNSRKLKVDIGHQTP